MFPNKTKGKTYFSQTPCLAHIVASCRLFGTVEKDTKLKLAFRRIPLVGDKAMLYKMVVQANQSVPVGVLLQDGNVAMIVLTCLHSHLCSSLWFRSRMRLTEGKERTVSCSFVIPACLAQEMIKWDQVKPA